MPEPTSYPTPQQTKIIWTAATAFAGLVIAGIVFIGGFVFIRVLSALYPVLLPLGVAIIIAYLVDPLLVKLEKRHINRHLAIFIILVLVMAGLALCFFFIIPRLVQEITLFVSNVPNYVHKLQDSGSSFLGRHPRLQEWLDEHQNELQATLPGKFGSFLGHAWAPFQQLFSWIGFFIGFVFVPLYVYYLLIEKNKIERNWKLYVPMQQTWWMGELLVVVREINYYVVVFFRGQVLVAAMVGIMTAIGLQIIGLPYALLIGLGAGVLGLVPYLGVASSLIVSLLVAYGYAKTSTEAWLLPVEVLGVFAVVQFFEGIVITPRIMGNKTGLHPLTVILSILIWSSFLPGLLGPILAVPLTATLRVLMYRYFWGAIPNIPANVTHGAAK